MQFDATTIIALSEHEICSKVHIFWEGHKILQNLHLLFILCNASQIIGGDFAKICGLLRIYELYWNKTLRNYKEEWNEIDMNFCTDFIIKNSGQLFSEWFFGSNLPKGESYFDRFLPLKWVKSKNIETIYHIR